MFQNDAPRQITENCFRMNAGRLLSAFFFGENLVTFCNTTFVAGVELFWTTNEEPRYFRKVSGVIVRSLSEF